MLIGDIIYSDDFDCNCNYEIWKGQHHESGSELLFSTLHDGYKKPLDYILDMHVKYLTISDNILVLEAAPE